MARWFSSLRIQARFLAVFALFIFFGTLSTTGFLFIIDAMDIQTIAIVDDSRDLVRVSQLQALVEEERRHADEYALSGEAEQFTRYAGTRENVEESLEDILADVGGDDDVLSDFVPIGEDIAANHQAFDEMIRLHLEGEFAQAQQTAQEVTVEQAPQYDIINDEISYLVTLNTLRFEDTLQTTGRLTQIGIVAAAVTLLALFASSVLAALATNSVVDPLLYLLNAVYSFENDSYNQDLLAPQAGRQDEIGVLMRAFDDSVNTITTGVSRTRGLLDAATRFVPQNYLDFLNKRSIEDLELGDHISANMAIMFSDIRGFTTLSEKMTPAENFNFVNDYLQRVSPVIQQNNGFVVKFLGDGMMAIFPYSVRDSLQAALYKLEAVKQLNTARKAAGELPIALGIGLHIGPMMIGMIGEAQRMQGDAFSDNVNLTARLEGLNKMFGTNIIISGDALDTIPDKDVFELRSLGLVQVKGRRTPIALYDVYEADGGEQRDLKHATRDTFQQALQAYKVGDLAQARALFKMVKQANNDDRAAQFYLDEIAQHQANDTQWTGVVVMTKK